MVGVVNLPLVKFSIVTPPLPSPLSWTSLLLLLMTLPLPIPLLFTFAAAPPLWNCDPRRFPLTDPLEPTAVWLSSSPPLFSSVEVPWYNFKWFKFSHQKLPAFSFSSLYRLFGTLCLPDLLTDGCAKSSQGSNLQLKQFYWPPTAWTSSCLINCLLILFDGCLRLLCPLGKEEKKDSIEDNHSMFNWTAVYMQPQQ